jgi:phospholipase D1/2
MIFVPLLPAFAGDIVDSGSTILRIQVNYQQSSMAKGQQSLIELLKTDGVQDPWRYVRFFSLRNHGQSPVTGIPTEEMIYIHSKAMIVDDRAFIIGSANINDRSMLGSRDQEIAVVVKYDERASSGTEDKREIIL